MAWAFLAGAIVFEIAATSLIKLTEGFTKPWWTLLVLFGYGVSFTLMAQAVKTLDVGLVYAIWSGVGIAAIAVIGIVFLDESLTWPKIVGLGLILAGVLVLNLMGGHGTSASASGTPSM